MAVFKCKMCGANLQIGTEESVIECEYCATPQTVPCLDNEKKIQLFQRANNLRLRCEFDQALAVYAGLVAEFPQEAEAYWGLILCRYGIEYVDDPKTGRKIPTCHRVSTQSILHDPDYQAALTHASPLARMQYEKEGAALDALMAHVLEVASREKPYDIFICYKESDDSTGQRTEDSTLAQDLYTNLVEKGFRVFYSRVTLRNLAGVDYESYIYSALSSASVMIVLGTKTEYFEAVWVKNEWARYLKMMEEDAKKSLIVCYRDMDGYDLPVPFKNLQALDMNTLTFHENLMQSIGNTLAIPTAESGERSINVLRVLPYASNDDDEHWENGQYLSEVDISQFKNVYLHYYISREDAEEKVVKASVKVRDSRNVTIYTAESDWTLKEGRREQSRSHRWRIRKKDGTFVQNGDYVVSVQVGSSVPCECPITIYSSKKAAAAPAPAPAPKPAAPTPPRKEPDPDLIRSVMAIGGKSAGDCWPKGSYTDEICKDRYPAVFFHLMLNQAYLRKKPSIHYQMTIYDSRGSVILDQSFDAPWQAHFDRLSQGWIIRGNDGSVVADGQYRAEFRVENSIPRSMIFRVTSDDSFMGKIKKIFG